ncbi:hypothetical protein [Cupriavidus plantarum]|uniref:hypothetical protein n=1 Tax=Cupriavidus plantarum TaxID=942865 RepID=UPI001B0170B7|nr:hypothetical protein [Cupriavidus plantarum]CAG2127777.1 hypothetical protein LMG26296_00820 [Cupriavidus plantarum]SMR67045.1 hypothetical protein SAMN05421735_1938 [Cupriavidus plantarum]
MRSTTTSLLSSRASGAGRLVRRIAASVALAATVAALTACSTLAPVQTGQKLIGQPESAVRATFGQPTDMFRLKDGTTRWIYSTQPLGEDAYAATFDRNGNLADFRNMLTTEELYKAQVNVWTKQDVLEHYGAPREPNQYFPIMKREVWTYRFFQDRMWYSMFNFYFDDAGVLRQTQITPDPLRDRPER